MVVVWTDPHGVDLERHDNVIGHQVQLFRCQKTASNVGLIGDYEQLETSRAQSSDRLLDSRLKFELGNMPWSRRLSIAKYDLINHAIAVKEYRTAGPQDLPLATTWRCDRIAHATGKTDFADRWSRLLQLVHS
jgi:hypothetical protein